MHSATDQRSRNLLIAYAAPMVVFIGCFGLISLIKLTHGQSLWLRSPEFWVYPLQTVACAVLLIIFWRRYEFHPVRQLWLVLLVGFVSLAIWIAPQAFFGAAPRTDGFNPDLIASNPAAYWATVLLRFFRLVVVVPRGTSPTETVYKAGGFAATPTPRLLVSREWIQLYDVPLLRHAAAHRLHYAGPADRPQ